MTSQWQGMKASACRRSILKDEPSEEMQSATCHLETTTGALGSLCRQFQRRLPLRAVSLNLGAGPSWKRLETPTPEPEQQGLQAAARSAKNALGAMSQVIVTTNHLFKGLLRANNSCPQGPPKNINSMKA
jgi:hypothetical protein